MQIILVDDGSTDDSLKICEKYIEFDERIQIIHKENGGLMSAWIAGIERSNCEYTIFIDSDDWVELDIVEKFVECVSKQKYDLVISNHVQEFDEKSIKINERCPQGEYDNFQLETKIFPVLLNNNSYFGRGINLCRCSKLIKTELIKMNLKYCDTRVSYGEDLNIMLPIFLDCKNIFVLNDYLYHYRQNPCSIMNSYKKIWNYKLKF